MTCPADADLVGAALLHASGRTGVSLSGLHGRWLRSAVSELVRERSAAGLRATVEPPFDDETYERLCELVTIQEGFFLRERDTLDSALGAVMPAIVRRHEPVAVWSAGCADGEEAYTISMLLRPLCRRDGYRVLGTDLSSRAIVTATEGRYTPWSLRGLDETEIDAYFSRDEQMFRVRDEYRKNVAFELHNLLDSPPRGSAAFDVVLCRNVLIYLTPGAVRLVARRLADSLAPGGVLVTGAADPLLDGTDELEPLRSAHGVMYRRRVAGASSRPVGPAHPTRRSGTRATVDRTHAPRRLPSPMATEPASVLTAVPGPDALAAAEAALHDARPQDAAVIAGRAVLHSPTDPAAHSVLIRAEAAMGHLDRARQAAETAVRRFPLDSDAHYLRALVLLELGDPGAAAEAARRAVYLDPDHAAAHLVRARCRAMTGHPEESVRHSRIALRLLGVVAS